MKKLFFAKMFFVLLIPLLNLTCSEEDDNSENALSNTKIEWVAPASGDIVSVSNYTNGVYSGESYHQKFNVQNESGLVIINGSLLNGDQLKHSDTINVEKGKQYLVVTRLNYASTESSSAGTTCESIILSSPNSSTNSEINISSYPVTTSLYYSGAWHNQTFYYCPGSVTLENVSISLDN